jgi:cystathionine gamma-lyase
VVFDYARCGNPTRAALERNLAAMEGAKFAFACSSGMAAHVTVMNLLKRGDHILCVDDVYGGTQRYLRKILTPNSEIELDLCDFSDIEVFKKMIKPNTKVCWLETPTNPTLKIFDIQKISDALKGTGVLLVVDNTFSTPINTNPLALGADIVSHSLTKYIGGHSDVIAGALMLNDKELYDRLYFVLKSMGTGLSAFDSWIALRGSKTLEVRVSRAQENAIAIAKFLESHAKVDRVIFPGLESHPQHLIDKKQSRGPGAMISFYIKGGITEAATFLKALKVFTLAESLGGVESLIEHPALMTHGSVPIETRKMLGIEDNFIRVSCGIETLKDLIEDLAHGLDKI